MVKQGLTVIMIGMFILCFSGCPGTGAGEDLAVDVDGVGWIYYNCDPDFQNLVWSNPPYLSTSYMWFNIAYSGTEIQPGELTSFTAESGSVFLNVPVAGDIYKDSGTNPDRHYFDSYYLYSAGSDTHLLPLGPWTFTLTFVDGSESTAVRTFNKPGTADPLSGGYVVTEDYSGTDATHLAMVKRAAVSSAVYDSGSNEITVGFSINDSQVRSGRMVLYNENGDFVGRGLSFVSDSGVISSELGGVFHTDGTANTYTASLEDYPELTVDLNLQHYAVVECYDGKQYEILYPGAHDCVSISAPRLISAP